MLVEASNWNHGRPLGLYGIRIVGGGVINIITRSVNNIYLLVVLAKSLILGFSELNLFF